MKRIASPSTSVFALVLVAAVVVGGDEELGGVTTSTGQRNSSKIAAFGKCSKICTDYTLITLRTAEFAV